MTKRRDFLAVAQGHSSFLTDMVIQVLYRNDGKNLIRVGFVASRKVGNAVKRNYAKRKMRSLALETLPSGAQPGCDYVLIARHSILKQNYQNLKKSIEKGLKKMNTQIGKK